MNTNKIDQTPARALFLNEAGVKDQSLVIEHMAEWAGVKDTFHCTSCDTDLPRGYVHAGPDCRDFLAVWN